MTQVETVLTGFVLASLLGFAVATFFVFTILYRILDKVEWIVDTVSTFGEDDLSQAGVASDHTYAPGEVPAPQSQSLLDMVFKPKVSDHGLTNGTFRGKQAWEPEPPVDDEQ